MVRIFVFGESAAYGDPKPEFDLPRLLEALLQGSRPGVRFEVVNAAMTAINSHAILPIARECARQNGDIWVIYMGNNEVVGPFGPATVFGVKAPDLRLIRALLALKATRVVQWLDGLLAHLRPEPPHGNEWGGMAMFVHNQVRQDDPRMACVYANFQRNLTDILDAGRRGGAKIVVSTMVANLKDCAPFGAQHRPDLTAAGLEKWDDLYDKGERAQQAGSNAAAARYFRQADQIDDTFADLHFRWGRCCVALGQDAEALRHFTLARDEDTLRFRADTRINEIIRQTVSHREKEGIYLADAEQALARQSPHGLTGGDFLYEHVHLNFDGNYLLARSVCDEVAKALPVAAAGPWPSRADCARRLRWTDFNRYEAEVLIYDRAIDPPFTRQLSHEEQCDGLRRQIEQLLPCLQHDSLLQSEAALREALTGAPDDWVLHRSLARLREKLGDTPGATDSWRRVTELRPNYTEAWEEMAGLLISRGRDSEALGALQQALRLNPQSAGAHLALAQILAREGKHEESLREHEAALKLNPQSGPAHFSFGKLLEDMKKPDDARRQFEAAMQDRTSGHGFFIALGAFCFERAWWDRAATNYLDALRLIPWDAPTQLRLGLTLAQMGRHTEAQSRYAEAARLAPNSPEAHFRLGYEMSHAGMNGAAIEQFEQALRLDPDLVEAHLDLGVALSKQFRKTEALHQFREVLRLSPTNAAALRNIQLLQSVPAPDSK
jgi:tetratricopeptide (TPR) repeat protein